MDAETNFFSCRALDSHFRINGSTHGLSGKMDLSLGSEEVNYLHIDYTVLPLEDTPEKRIGSKGSYFLIRKEIIWDNTHVFRPHSEIIVKIKAPWFSVSDEDLNKIELRGSATFTLSKGQETVISKNEEEIINIQYVERPSEPESVELVCKVNPKVFVTRKE